MKNSKQPQDTTSETSVQKAQVVILGAGNGTRMNHALPKVLIPVKGKPIIKRLVGVAQRSKLTEKPVVVVSEKNKNLIKDTLGDTCTYVVQKQQLGTGHAVLCAKDVLHKKFEYIVVLNGDHPFVQPQTINNLVDLAQKEGTMIALATATIPEFSGWKKTFFDFGRILRDHKGNIVGIREKKDASPKELDIKEVNVAYYCFNADWLWKTLPKVKNNNTQSEYYITDIVKLAIDNRQKVSHYTIDPRQALGINTQEHLQFARKSV